MEINPEDVVPKLKALGATKFEQGLVKVKAYDFPDDRLRKDGSYLRVREIAGRTEVIHKKKIDDTKLKVMEETEIITDDFDTSCEIFVKLGMKKFCDHEKYRASYKLGDVKIEFDKYPGLPWFFEVDSDNEDDVRKTVELLGFDFDDDKKVSGEMIIDIYGVDAVHFTTFKQFNETPAYDKLFE